MESANLRHHHQLHPDHQLLVGSSTLATPCLSVGNSHSFASNPLLNSSSIHTSSGEVLFRDLNPRNDVILQELACHSWLNNNRGNTANVCFIDPSPEHDHNQYLGNMKEEINSESSSSFSKFTDLLNSGDLSRIQENDEEQKQMNDLSEKLMLKTLLISPNYHVGGILHPSRGAFHPSLGSANNVPFTVGATLSQIHPTVNVSNLRNMSSGFPGSMDVNLKALDLFSMDRSSVESVNNRPMDVNSPGLGEDGSQLGFTGMQQYSRLKQSVDLENLPSSFDNNGILTGPRRPKPKAPQSVSKRPRAESRISCPPLKVRKEKLGDRIAALQQMVAPFGKTDTASVLMEAFGYIKFLQNQVETLSVPYMKLASRRKCSNTNTIQEGSGVVGGNAEPKADLKSRGLCLVPLSCMSYITNDGGGAIWPPNPPNFNPGF